MSSNYVGDATERRVRELATAGYSLRNIQEAVGISRPTVVAILRDQHKPRSVSPETKRRFENEEERRLLQSFRAEVARRRFIFERDWANNEPYIERFVANWNPPEGVL